MSSFNLNGVTTNSTRVILNDSFKSQAEQASSAWRNFEHALRSILEHSPMLSKAAEAIDRQGATEFEVQEKDKRIAELKSTIRIQLEESGECY